MQLNFLEDQSAHSHRHKCRALAYQLLCGRLLSQVGLLWIRSWIKFKSRLIDCGKLAQTFFECCAASKQAAKSKECTTAQASTRYAFVVSWASNGQDAYTAADIHQDERVRLGEIESRFLT